MQNLLDIGEIPEPPKIPPVPEGVERPLFSVMIPVCNRTKYLRQALESVLHENYPPDQMQICIVDNSTEIIDWDGFLTPQERQRIEIFRQSEHVGMAENWNACITQSRGHLVHILHDDDWILPGFYDEIKRLESLNSSAALLATRNIFLDTHDVWTGISPILETTGKIFTNLNEFFFTNPIQCPAIVIRRQFYEKHGGFLTSLKHTLDWEMWHRSIHVCGGVVSNKVLSFYRMHDSNDTTIAMQTASNLKDRLKCMLIFQKRNPEYPFLEGVKSIIRETEIQENILIAKGNQGAANLNRDFRDFCVATFGLEKQISFQQQHGHSLKAQFRQILGTIKRRVLSKFSQYKAAC
jgi:glycosyltransferase involved in cell wall biosynthesis